MEYKKEDFPKIAIYRKPENRIAFASDFKDGQIVYLLHFHSRPGATKEGLAVYEDSRGYSNLVNIKDLAIFS